jgi:hypothetical protein
MHSYLGKEMDFMKKTLLMFACVSLVACLVCGCGGGGGGGGGGVGTDNSHAISAAFVPDPPPDDPNYFQIMIDNRITSQTVHLTVLASRMLIGGTDLEERTWLTGGGAGHADWTAPVFQKLNRATGAVTADFASTYDFTLDKLPLDSSGNFRILKVPFRDPGNPAYTLGGSARVFFTLGTAAKMARVTTYNTATPPAITGYAISTPSNDPTAIPTGGQDRWDFMEFTLTKPDENGKHVAFVNTTNVDFFSLGVTIEGRRSTGVLTTFGLSLADATPVASTISALAAIGGTYAAGYTVSDSGSFLRFRAPSLVWSSATTGLKTAIDDAWTYYGPTTSNALQFNVGTVTYKARVDGAGNLVFSEPAKMKTYTETTRPIDKPTSLDVVAATGKLQVTDQDGEIRDGLKFLAAYLNRGVFENTAVWHTPSAWYPAGSTYNKYAYTLHQRFVNGAVYGFSFDDVPGNGVTSDPSINNCTAMTVTLTID